MTVTFNGIEYYRTKEAADALRVSKQTLLRWITEEKIADAGRRDRNGWRLFSDSDIKRIRTWMNEGSR